MALEVLQPAEARVELDAVAAAVVRAGHALAAVAPHDAVEAVSGRRHVRQQTTQLIGQQTAQATNSRRRPGGGISIRPQPCGGTPGSSPRNDTLLRFRPFETKLTEGELRASNDRDVGREPAAEVDAPALSSFAEIVPFAIEELG